MGDLGIKKKKMELKQENRNVLAAAVAYPCKAIRMSHKEQVSRFGLAVRR